MPFEPAERTPLEALRAVPAQPATQPLTRQGLERMETSQLQKLVRDVLKRDPGRQRELQMAEVVLAERERRGPGGPGVASSQTPAPQNSGPERTPTPQNGGPERTPTPQNGGPERTPTPQNGGPERTPTPQNGGPERAGVGVLPQLLDYFRDSFGQPQPSSTAPAVAPSTSFSVEALERMSTQEIHGLIWGELKQPGRELEREQAEKVLALKTGEKADERKSDEANRHPVDSVEYYAQEGAKRTPEGLRSEIEAARMVIARFPTAAYVARMQAKIEGFEAALKQQQEHADERHRQAMTKLAHSLPTSELENHCRALAGLESVGGQLAITVEVFKAVITGRKSGELPEPRAAAPYAFHPEARGTLPDPVLAGEHRGFDAEGERKATYEPLQNVTLFGPKGPEVSDVLQGRLMDCWLLAGLVSLIGTHPEVIRAAVGPLEGSQASVRLFVPQPDGSYQRQSIRVDVDLPVANATSGGAASSSAADRLLYAKAPLTRKGATFCGSP